MAQQSPSPYFASYCCINGGDRRDSCGVQQFGHHSEELRVGLAVGVCFCGPAGGCIGGVIGTCLGTGDRLDISSSIGVRIRS